MKGMLWTRCGGGAHCPLPVSFLDISKQILCWDACLVVVVVVGVGVIVEVVVLLLQPGDSRLRWTMRDEENTVENQRPEKMVMSQGSGRKNGRRPSAVSEKVEGWGWVGGRRWVVAVAMLENIQRKRHTHTQHTHKRQNCWHSSMTNDDHDLSLLHQLSNLDVSTFLSSSETEGACC